MPQMAAMGGGRGNMAKGMEAVAKEMEKIDGVPVESTMKMGATASAPASSETCSAEPQTSAKPTSGESSGGIAGALAGRLGGFGKRKSEDSSKEQAKTSSDAQGCSASGSLMEMTTTLNGFSAGPADASKFEIPAGYKQVERR
jgi:hypothetical protein